MSMINDGKQAEMAGSKLVAKMCKPDYESMISVAKDKMAKSRAALDAIIAMLDGSSPGSKMAELVGELYIMESNLGKRIQYLIQEQESWED